MSKQLILLQKHFDTALETPNGIKKLRELILTLAMQGKLVPQDPNDQPASELLKEIEAEKKRLIKEGKIKKQEPLPPIKPEEIPYPVPDGWVWCKLGSITNIQTGKKDVNEGHENGEYPFFSCAQIPLKSNDYSYDCESLLLPGNGANVGQVTYYNGKFEAYQRTYILNNFFFGTINYIQCSIQARFLKSLEGKQYGSAINYIKLGSLTDFLIPLPPLAEQKQIVAKIDALMALCDKLETERNARNQKKLNLHTAAINRLLTANESETFDASWQFIKRNFGELYSTTENVKSLKKSILQLAVQGKLVPQDPQDQPASELLKEIEREKNRLIKEGKIKKQEPLPPIKPEEIPYSVPKNWAWVRLHEVIDVRDGTHDSPKYLDSGIPLITSKDFVNGEIDFSQAKFISLEDHNKIKIRSKVDKDDILFSMIGGNIGNMVMVNFDNIEFSIKNVALFKYYDNTKVLPHYLIIFLKVMTSKIQSNASGGAQPFVSLTFLRNHHFPLPPLAEQKRIVAKIDALRKKDRTVNRKTDRNTQCCTGECVGENYEIKVSIY